MPAHTLAGGTTGSRVGAAGDVDGDGYADVLVGALGSAVHLYSGKTGERLLSVADTAQDFGQSVGRAGDANRDGVEDFFAASASTVRIYSGDARAMTVDRGVLSVQSGGTQTMFLSGGATHGLKLYLVLGSMSGTSPGLRIGKVELPLQVDPYFMFTAANPNTLIVSSVGILDGNGMGQAKLVLPPGLAKGLANQRLHHAFLAIDLLASSFDFASNAVSLLLER